MADKRVSFYRNETNVGLVGNWNKCLAYAKGQYVKFLCADDKFFPQMLEKFVAILDQYPEVAIVGSHTEVFGLRNFCRVSPFVGYVKSKMVREVLLGPYNQLRNPSAVMFRMTDVQKVGTFNPKLHQLTDREYYLRLLTHGDCYIVPETLCYVRSHETRESVMVNKRRYEGVFERYWMIDGLKSATTPNSNFHFPGIDIELKKRAIRAVAVMYELLPKLYKKKNRILLKKAYEIAHAESVVVAPISHYLRWDYFKKLIGKK